MSHFGSKPTSYQNHQPCKALNRAQESFSLPTSIPKIQDARFNAIKLFCPFTFCSESVTFFMASSFLCVWFLYGYNSISHFRGRFPVS